MNINEFKLFQKKRDFVILFVLTFLLVLPSINKPYHIEGNFYVNYGHYLSHNQLKPYEFTTIYDSKRINRIFGMSHPPGAAYFIGVIFYLFPNANEEVIHSIYGIFLFLLVWGIYRLASFCKYPLFPAILAMVTPAVLITSESVMPDLASLSIALTAIWIIREKISKAFLLKNQRSNYNYSEKYFPKISIILLYLIVSLLLVVSWFMSYPCFIYTLISPFIFKNKSRARFLPAIFSITIFIMWEVKTFYNEGIPEFISSYIFSQITSISYIENTVSFLASIGGVVIFPIVLLVLLQKVKEIKQTLILVLISVFLEEISMGKSVPIISKIEMIFLIYTGLLLLVKLVMEFYTIAIQRLKVSNIETEDGNNSLKFPIEFFGLLGIPFVLMNIFIVNFGAVRYIVPLVPIFVIYLCYFIEKKYTNPKKLKMYFVLAAVSTFIFTGALVKIDYDFASTYRDFFKDKTLLNIKKGEGTVYLVGKFAFQYYGEKEQYKHYIKNETILAEGDIIIRPLYCGISLRQLLPEDKYKRLILLTRLEYSGIKLIPIRLVNYEFSAGFYCSLVGLLPYAITNEPLEVFSVYLFR